MLRGGPPFTDKSRRVASPAGLNILLECAEKGDEDRNSGAILIQASGQPQSLGLVCGEPGPGPRAARPRSYPTVLLPRSQDEILGAEKARQVCMWPGMYAGMGDSQRREDAAPRRRGRHGSARPLALRLAPALGIKRGI